MAESTGSKPPKVEDVSVLTDELAVGLFPFRRGFVNKPAEAVRHIIRQPGAAELFVGTQSPHGELAHVDLQTVLKGKEDICKAAVLEYGDILELAAVFQDTLIGEETVDAVEPLLRITVAALQNKPFLAVHPAKVIDGYGADAHNYIPPICKVSSWTSSSANSDAVISSPKKFGSVSSSSEIYPHSPKSSASFRSTVPP